MKYSYLILLGLMFLAPAAYAVETNGAGQVSMIQSDIITVNEYSLYYLK
jgi:hypothetical protein